VINDFHGFRGKIISCKSNLNTRLFKFFQKIQHIHQILHCSDRYNKNCDTTFHLEIKILCDIVHAYSLYVYSVYIYSNISILRPRRQSTFQARPTGILVMLVWGTSDIATEIILDGSSTNGLSRQRVNYTRNASTLKILECRFSILSIPEKKLDYRYFNLVFIKYNTIISESCIVH